MKNSLLVVIFTSFFILPSCVDEDSENPVFRLNEFNSGYAQSDRSRAFPFPNSEIGSSLSHCCMVEYKNGKVSKVIHKNAVSRPLLLTGGLKSQGIDTYHNFFYKGNLVTLISGVDSKEVVFKPEEIQLTLDVKGNLIKRINCQLNDTTDYFYSDNGLLSKSVSSNGGYSKVTRFFYFDSNKNLVRINGEIDNGWGYKYFVFEYFEEYDTAINGFKNLGIIEGAFIRSLSQNNFNVYACATYDGESTLLDTMRITLPIDYDENGYPIYGDCSNK